MSNTSSLFTLQDEFYVPDTQEAPHTQEMSDQSIPETQKVFNSKLLNTFYFI